MVPKATTNNFLKKCLPNTQHTEKTKNHQNQGRTDKKSIFASVPKSPTQVGSLGVKNASKKFSRLVTFKGTVS
jgi:hypothetical protein